jgi:predicted dithiol-disulfide oxidoreductase (DUF899 family)
VFRTHRAATRTSATCTMWIDGVNGVAQHIAQNIDVAVVAAADPKALRDHARARGSLSTYSPFLVSGADA